MFSKIKNTLFLIIFSIFTFLITKHYFSDENVIFTNKSRSSYALQVNIDNKTITSPTINCLVMSPEAKYVILAKANIG